MFLCFDALVIPGVPCGLVDSGALGGGVCVLKIFFAFSKETFMYVLKNKKKAIDLLLRGSWVLKSEYTKDILNLSMCVDSSTDVMKVYYFVHLLSLFKQYFSFLFWNFKKNIWNQFAHFWGTFRHFVHLFGIVVWHSSLTYF